MAIYDPPRDSTGNFQQTVSDEEIITTLATASRPLQTSEVGSRVGLARSGVYDRLVSLEQDGQIDSWLVTSQARIWDIPGNWGTVSLLDLSDSQPVSVFLERGVFPWSISNEGAVQHVRDALAEFCLQTTPEQGGVYQEWEKVATLFSHLSPQTLSEQAVTDALSSGRFTVPRLSAERFREHRQQSRITHGTLSDETGIQVRHISEWERGRRELSAEKKSALEDALVFLAND